MLNKIRLFILFCLLFSGVNIFAKPVSQKDTENVAKNWMFQQTGKHLSIQKVLASNATGQTSGAQTKLRIIKLSPAGWVIVSSDDVAQPVLAYGESSIDLFSQPPGFTDWITQANLQIEAAIQSSNSRLGTTSQTNSMAGRISNEWKRLTVDVQTFSKQKNPLTALGAGSGVAPLLWVGGSSEGSGINWGQGDRYNAKCPYDSTSQYDNHVLVGCVATAMGQIMRYYQSPAQGAGSHSYTENDYGTLSADFGNTIYYWSSMPYQLSGSSSGSEIDAVSTLLYQAGVSVDMDYGTGESLAYPHHVPYALKTYFGYKEAEYYERSTYSDDRWNSNLRVELDAGRPLFYGGFNPDGQSGHAFVLDGYDTSGYYHFNWGWSGYLNGYFSLNDLTPGNFNYTANQNAVRIIASSSPIPPTPPDAERRTDVTELYVATFERAPESAGLNYWVNSALSIEGIASSFFEQAETQQKYPPGTTIGEFVNAVYSNLFNRYPDQAGFDYWVDELYYKRITPSLFILAVINGAQGDDATILANKTAVGLYFADSGLTDVTCAFDIINNIDATDQSVSESIAYIDNGCTY